MKLRDRLGKLFPFVITSRNKLNEQKNKKNTRGVPFGSTRSSIPVVDSFAPNQRLVEIPPDFAIEWLSTLENLAAYNHDVSYALDNIVQLANTDHKIEFADDTPDEVQKEVSKLISDEQDNWYNHSEGIRSFKSDILAQGVINGAMSCEIVPDILRGTIDQIVRVPPKYIRFVYDRKIDRFIPYQQVTNLLSGNRGTGDMTGLKRLNQKTYKYIAWRRLFEGPYPTPPFIAAIEGLIIQKDMINNFSSIMSKLGMLGFLTAKVEPPEQEEGEDDTAYFNRCKTYLNDVVYPQLDKNLGTGVVAGFKDSHEFELVGNKMNVAGAEGLVKIVELIIFAGLKQDPNMLGRNYSTTETFGRVILAKMLNQVRDWQTMADSIFKDMYRMFIMLKGYDPEIIKEVVSEAPMVTDREKEEKAEQTKLSNIKTKRNMGIIDQQTAAVEAGYDKPAVEDWEEMYGYAEEPGQEPKNKNPEDDDGTGKEPEAEVTDEERRAKIAGLEKRLNKDVVEYHYDCPDDCNDHKHKHFTKSSDFGDKEMNKLVNKYFNDTMKNFNKAVVKTSKSAVESLATMTESTPLHQIQDEIYISLLTVFEGEFVDKQLPISERNMDKIYSHFRTDTSIFPNTATDSNKFQFADGGFEPPTAVFDLDDYRTMEYLAQSDSMYLGKFITDESTKKKVYNYIEDQYIKGYLPVGAEPKVLKKFQKEFENFLATEAWKVQRVIDTSVNNARNDANIMYMNQAAVEKYEVSEIWDQLTCDWCKRMDGVKYSVSAAKNKVTSKVDVGPENVSMISPFATDARGDDGKRLSAKEFTDLSDDDISKLNITTPSYHPLCRGRIIAVI